MQVPPSISPSSFIKLGEALEDAVIEGVAQWANTTAGPRLPVRATFPPPRSGCPHRNRRQQRKLTPSSWPCVVWHRPGEKVINQFVQFLRHRERSVPSAPPPVFVDVGGRLVSARSGRMRRLSHRHPRPDAPCPPVRPPVEWKRLNGHCQRPQPTSDRRRAQASGRHWAGQAPGQLGRCGCFSFFPPRTSGGAGDGGAVTCRDWPWPTHRELAVHGMPRRYLHTSPGVTTAARSCSGRTQRQGCPTCRLDRAAGASWPPATA